MPIPIPIVRAAACLFVLEDSAVRALLACPCCGRTTAATWPAIRRFDCSICGTKIEVVLPSNWVMTVTHSLGVEHERKIGPLVAKAFFACLKGLMAKGGSVEVQDEETDSSRVADGGSK